MVMIYATKHFSFIICESAIKHVYQRNYLSCQEKLGKLGVKMETKARSNRLKTKEARSVLPLVQNSCDFEGYDA